MKVNQQTLFIFKLQQNIALEGDLLLAKMELDTFLPGSARSIGNIASLVQEIPRLAYLANHPELISHVRRSGAQAYLAEGPLTHFPLLIRRLSFMQRVYGVTQNTEMAQRLLQQAEKELGPVFDWYVAEDAIIIHAIPHYALFEFASVIARQSSSVKETKQNLTALLAALLGRSDSRHAEKLAEAALSAQSTTAHLSHDLHYYKAKFFPRMARSMLNMGLQKTGAENHRVIDNFSGSGTTLLEAATLGIPSVGLDIDPLSVLIAKTKLEAIYLDSELLFTEVCRTLPLLEARAWGQYELFSRASFAAPAIKFPKWLLKNRNMTSDMVSELSQGLNALRTTLADCDPQVKNLFSVLASDAISRKIRMRFLGTGVGRFSLTFAKTPLLQMFSKSLEKYTKVIATIEWLRQTIPIQIAAAHVIEADAKCVPDDLGTFDFLVTSPPYLPASSGRESYAKARAPSLLTLGMRDHEDVDDLVDTSIGSMDGNGVDLSQLTDDERRAVEWLSGDEMRSIKAEPTARYFLDMRQVFHEMARILAPGALAIVVSGKQSTFYNFSTRETLYVINAAELLAEEAQSAGFEVEALHDIQLNKSNMNARPRSLDDYYETLIVLRKPTF